ncbi:molybdate ABC transporter substrate-binding protein [Methylobacterium frigidaeris]|uniref:Aconitate isomerase n=1 Tax=Methylobacterium frigidaeris TaxID=2038277 RepID=A0AA37M141_9HYPH|nr:substrate-binding domain-containing protein [Methylobacterium frigidaeris]PIK72050.1 molybdenum ABC transporter substrate-binding protein [Methylobacterium frigidaeris]GJD59978.1 Aconitate isomerase [Methylobacterium frigidaeris]
MRRVAVPIRIFRRTSAAACLVLALVATARAAEITLLTTGAYKPVAAALVPEFERRTGHTVTIRNDTAGAVAQAIRDGARPDLVVLTPAGLEALIRDRRLAGAPPIPLAKVGIGVAVRDGAPMPDIATVAGFREALLRARAVAMVDPASGGSSGIYLAQLFERLGIADQLKDKLVLVRGGLAASRLVSGEADLALQQTSELLSVAGARLVGPIPVEVQNDTVYAGMVPAGAAETEAASALLRDLGGPAAGPVLAGKGMVPPGP